MTTTSALVIPSPDMLPRGAPRSKDAVRLRTIAAHAAISVSDGYAGWAVQLGADDPASGRKRDRAELAA